MYWHINLWKSLMIFIVIICSVDWLVSIGGGEEFRDCCGWSGRFFFGCRSQVCAGNLRFNGSRISRTGTNRHSRLVRKMSASNTSRHSRVRPPGLIERARLAVRRLAGFGSAPKEAVSRLLIRSM